MLHNLPHRHSPIKRLQGFTLIELLMVIAVILILTGITFGISRGVQNAQARAKTKAELATMWLWKLLVVIVNCLVIGFLLNGVMNEEKQHARGPVQCPLTYRIV